MTEERKIQLGTSVDATGAAQGFEKVKQGAREMAQSVSRDGAAAGKGLDAIGEGAKRGADGVARAASQMRSALDRALLDYRTAGKSLSEKFEAKIDFKGLNRADFAPQLAAMKEMEQAQEAVARAAAESAAAIRSAQVQSGRQSSFLDGLKQQSDAIGKTRSQLLELQAAELGVANAAAPYIAKLREAEQAQRGFAAAGKLTAFQQQQIGFQLHDFAVQVFSGQSPITALVQQGSQLSGTFGGTGNAIKAVTSLITPMKAAVGGAALSVAALAFAMHQAESAARDLASVQAQLTGTGRGGMFSDKELKAFISELALAPGVTRTAATGIVSELAKVHDIGGGLFKDLGKLAVDFAAATGQKLPEATRQLARAFADPVKGAKDLDEALGSLTSAQLLEIERLQRIGDIVGARNVLKQSLESIRGLADSSLTPLGRSINELGNAWERAMQSLEKSEGLRTLNALLAKTIDGVTWLINNGEKISNLGQKVGSFVAPPGAQSLYAFVKEKLGVGETKGDGTLSTGNLARLDRRAEASATEADIKRALEAGKAYKSEAQQIKELKETREGLTKALKEAVAQGKEGKPAADQLRGNIAGINEKIASIGKRGQGAKDNEPQQVADAQLAGQVKAARDALAAERDAIAFSQRFLQGVFQAGELSLRDFYEQKRKAIEEGTAAEIAALDAERADVLAHLEKTKKLSPKDTSKIEQDQNRLAEIDREKGKFRLDASREVVLANQEESAAFRQLNEQVLAYRANLLQLQGDEVGAAKVRAQIAIQQAQILAKQSQGSANPITAQDQAATQRALEQTNEIAAARTRLGVVTQNLGVEEERIALLQRTGSIGELEALDRIGAARSSRLGQLQKEVAELERLAKLRPQDIQLNLDASRARLELDRLNADIDPLKQKFDGIFKDAGANLFGDLMNGTKPRDALRNFANSITREINGVVAKSLSQQLFGDGGPLGGLGKAAADIFGSPKRGVSLDSSIAAQSLENFRATGVDPATSALTNLTEAAQATAVQLRQVTGTPLPPVGTAGDFARYDRSLGTVPTADGSGATGDFARFDRAQEKATETTNAGAKADQNAARAVTQLAQAAANGGSALNSLPAILQSISSAGGYGNPGGLIGAGLNYLLGGSATAAFSQTALGSSGFGTGLAYGNQDLGLFFSGGGYTGDVDPKKAAGIVHGREYVFSAEATQAIGVDHLERLHKMAKTGQWGKGEAVPGYYDGGYVSSNPSLRSVEYLAPPVQTVRAGDTHVTNNHISVPVQAAPGMSRATATQLGAATGQGIATSLARNGKRAR